MIFVRVLIYEGDKKWLEGCRKNGLPVGRNDAESGIPLGPDRSILVVEPSELTFKNEIGGTVNIIAERTKP